MTVGARDGRPARSAVVSFAAAAVQVRPPQKQRGKHRGQRLLLWVVIAREVKPPTDVEPVEWIILTNEKTAGKAAIETVLHW